jgi:hypothetical protein
MLLEFKVANFRSVRDEQKLSFIASADSEEMPHNFATAQLANLADLRVLRSLAVYGANASGKTNILLAFQFFASSAAESFTKLQPEGATGTRPFALEKFYSSQPTTFEVSFLTEGRHFTYGLALTRERVTEEYLVARAPSGQGEIWFEREWDARSKTYSWSPPNDFLKYDEALRESTRDNCSFISAAAQFRHPQLTPIQRWFSRRTMLIRPLASIAMREDTARACVEEGAPYRDAIRELLRSADLGIQDVSVDELPDREDHLEPGEAPSDASSRRLPRFQRYDIRFQHKTRNGLAPLRYIDESAGTKRYFGLAAPWIRTLLAGGLILMDEIEASLHPLLVRELIELILDEKVNVHGAQLLFTTHNPILLDRRLLRPDQIWFTEKDETGATTLYPLTDYKQRPEESLVNGYLAGRYGGVPFIPESLLPSAGAK